MARPIIIRGNSGSGKTAAAKALQQKLGHHIMLISQDVVRREILRVKAGADSLALPLIKGTLEDTVAMMYHDILTKKGGAYTDDSSITGKENQA